MAENVAVQDNGVVSRDRVTTFVRHILYTAVHIEKQYTVVDLARLTRLKERTIRSYMANDEGERREPSLSAALSLASVLGDNAVNAVLSLINYGGARALNGTDEDSPMALVACLMDGLNHLTQAAADGEFDNGERTDLRPIVDQMIAKLVPLSSAGAAA